MAEYAADMLLVGFAVGGNLQDVMREEEARAAAARAAQPAVTDVKTTTSGAPRAGGWARVAAGSTASRGTGTRSHLAFDATSLLPYLPLVRCLLIDHFPLAKAKKEKESWSQQIPAQIGRFVASGVKGCKQLLAWLGHVALSTHTKFHSLRFMFICASGPTLKDIQDEEERARRSEARQQQQQTQQQPDHSSGGFSLRYTGILMQQRMYNHMCLACHHLTH